MTKSESEGGCVLKGQNKHGLTAFVLLLKALCSTLLHAYSCTGSDALAANTL